MQPSNAIIGDNTGVDLPEAPEDVIDLSEEKKMAKFSKSAEFKRLKEYLEGRIEFFQNYLPDGTAISSQKPEELVNTWIVANLVIGEFRAVINEYERVNKIVEDESSRT